MLECKQSEKDLAEDSWTFGELRKLSIDNFWTWDKSDGIGYVEEAYLGL